MDDSEQTLNCEHLPKNQTKKSCIRSFFFFCLPLFLFAPCFVAKNSSIWFQVLPYFHPFLPLILPTTYHLLSKKKAPEFFPIFPIFFVSWFGKLTCRQTQRIDAFRRSLPNAWWKRSDAHQVISMLGTKIVALRLR